MTSKRIMVVDDAEFTRKMLTLEVEQAGYKVVAEAENGLDAVDLYKTHQPDIVTMDIVMPGMGGIEAVKKIIEIDPNAKIVMLSSMGVGASVQEAVAAGAKNFILKPYSTSRLIEVLDKTLAL